MNTVKSLAIVALLVGGSSLAMAQNGPPGPGVNPASNVGQSAAPQTGAASGTRITHRTTHHMYMSARGSHHKTLKTGQPLPKQPQ
ncbi:MAG: hypothetical protein WAV38_16730 [Xanthobacteraceae bacterium]